MKANVKVTGGTLKDRQKCIRSIDLMVQAVVHPEFSRRVLAHKYNGKPGFSSCSLSPQEVLRMILDGAEVLQPQVDNEIDFDWKLYSKRFTSVIGWTNPKIMHINSNVLKLRKMSLAECAGHPFHEWTHKLGFGHDFDATKRRPYSVPYAVGYILRDVVNLILKEQNQNQEEVTCHTKKKASKKSKQLSPIHLSCLHKKPKPRALNSRKTAQKRSTKS